MVDWGKKLIHKAILQTQSLKKIEMIKNPSRDFNVTITIPALCNPHYHVILNG